MGVPFEGSSPTHAFVSPILLKPYVSFGRPTHLQSTRVRPSPFARQVIRPARLHISMSLGDEETETIDASDTSLQEPELIEVGSSHDDQLHRHHDDTEVDIADGGDDIPHDGSGNGDHGGEGDDDTGSHGEGRKTIAFLGTGAKKAQELAAQRLEGLTNATGKAYGSLMGFTGAFIKTVPPPVIVALISLVSTVSGTRMKVRIDKQNAEKANIAAAKKKKDDIEHQLRKTYNELSAPMLKSAAKLAERLYFIIGADWGTLGDAIDAKSKTNLSSTYSAYLLGRFLATVEIVKRENTLLDYGFPAADRIFANILGRIQGVLAANDYVLGEMQKTEHSFKPAGSQKALKGGPLRVSPKTQAVLGELIHRRIWSGKYDFIETAEHISARGNKATITFLEFSRILEKDHTMQIWYKPVIEQFARLENRIKDLPREKRRCNDVGARMYFLQSGLLDLVEFFDPGPSAKSIPSYRRRRLHLGGLRHREEQRAPQSLYKLYRELANVRDYRVAEGKRMERLRVSHGVEVYVGGTYGAGDTQVEKVERGDCPFSHRVLITLHEMGIGHKTVTIAPEAKPSWYYLLHPENRTPAIYHDGNLVEESGNIVGYLRREFPLANQLASADHLKLTVGTNAFTKFHPRFLHWMAKGNSSAKEDLEYELRKLNHTVAIAQQKNEGKPLLGGDAFSREDTAIAPMLHNIAVAGRALKGWELPKEFDALKRYLEAVRQMPSFVNTVATDDAIVRGYRHAGATGGERNWRLADLLE